MKPLLIAHRGDTIHFPENTLEAFESALNLGAGGIECDMQCFNHQLFLVHDYLFDRSQKYPHLPELLQKFAFRGRLEIEIKSMDLDFLPPLKKLLQQYKNVDFELTTSYFPLIPFLRRAFPNLPLGVIFPPNQFEDWMTGEFITLKIVKTMELLQGNVAHVLWRYVSQDLVEKLHQRQLKIHTHIARGDIKNQKAQYIEMERMEIDQATFDDIDLLQFI
ncbi:hypothetical protein CO015_04625 [candidate division WWE3 bacterium CG_4_8_14_3_um_filter_42_11]|uniref:GP-PDE domain-containing protein n=1 Tax=candidate division WWE3 bacterium CG_4_8_14_3_um_filter_42_11 TaxID=1975076 RepID=A0A2M8G5W7_UNCKA|nr:MAG: hypothetical protein CO015_04625 [candidate division WWE3 bacterium CG_4_8_14_3_um_filter_42_11]